MKVWTAVWMGVVLGILGTSCQKEEPTLFVSNNQELTLLGTPGEYREFTFKASSPAAVNRLVVYSKTSNQPTQLILDSTLKFPSKSITIEYFFRVPYVLDTMLYILSFEFYDAEGNSFNILRQLLSIPQAFILKEYTGLLMYSSKTSLAQSGIDLLKLQPVALDTLQSSQVDVYDTTSRVPLSGVLHSRRNGKFVRFNGFDYTNATNLTLKEAFESGLKLDYVEGVQKDDILLYYAKVQNTDLYTAIKVRNLEYRNDTLWRYEFAVKK